MDHDHTLCVSCFYISKDYFYGFSFLLLRASGKRQGGRVWGMVCYVVGEKILKLRYFTRAETAW